MHGGAIFAVKHGGAMFGAKYGGAVQCLTLEAGVQSAVVCSESA